MLIVIVFFCVNGLAQPREVARITVLVTAQPSQEKGVVTSKAETVNGKLLVRVGIQESGKEIAVAPGTYLLLRFDASSGAVGFDFSPPGILEIPQGRYHLPKDVIGILRGVNPGTATISVKELRPRASSGNGNPSGTTSPNWSGYEILGTNFTSVTGQWQVPSVSGDAGSSSASWIGIDGATNNSLIQVGTEQDWNSGILGIGQGPSYYAWWEVLPEPETQLPNHVTVGDVMLAEITRTNVAAGVWTIKLLNENWNWTATVQTTYTGPLDSAEWIEEAPSVCQSNACSILQLADYSLTHFDGESTNIGPANLTASESLNMVQGGVTVSSPSDPCDAGFNVVYGGTSPASPCNSGGGENCSTKKCSPPAICCDCTAIVCTTEANCQRMCGNSRRSPKKPDITTPERLMP
jgi:hypothetical protein